MQRLRSYIFLALLLLLTGCNRDSGRECADYRQAMRDFVVRISATARQQDPDFIVIPQNGIPLITLDPDNANGSLATGYLAAIDGHGQEDLFYGYRSDDMATPVAERDFLLGFLRRSREQGKCVLVTDYCSTPANVADSYDQCAAEGFVSFPAPSRDLDVIPNTAIHNENTLDISRLDQVQNFLYIINPEHFSTKEAFIEAVCATNYDLVIMDLFLDGTQMFTSEEVQKLRSKANGGKRLVICYMSIGEAENYRYYWHSGWRRNSPAWLAKENPDWPGNYKVRYWYPEWQEIICGAGDSYLNRVLTAGFDGVYLDIIDAYEYFE